MKSRFAVVALSVLPVLFLALAPAVPASAQGTSAHPGVLNNPTVNLPIQFDISPPLGDMAEQAVPQAGYHAPVVMRPKLQLLNRVAAQGGGPAPDGALQTSVGPLVNTTGGLDLLGVGNGFPNYTVPDAPSDVNLAVGDTQVVQWVNVSYAIFDKTTGAVLAGPIQGNAFWSGFGGTCQTTNSGDIIAQWDKLAHRWVMTQPVFSSPYMTCIAISTTADATGSYYRFAFPQSAGFPDYPKWGLMPDAYYQSQNIFNSSGTAFLGVNVCAYERAKLLAGDSTAKQICILDNSNGTLFDDSLLPADLDSASTLTLPPAGQAEVYMGSIDNANPNAFVYEYLFHADFTTPSNSTFTGVNGSLPITVSSFSLACGGFGACIPQKGTTSALDSLGDRLMYRLAYRNFSDHQTWLVSHSVTAGSSVGERWYEFHAPENSTGLSVFQQGTFAPDSNYRWMGSIAMDQSQDIALGYSLSSSTTYPSIYYTGRVPTDAAGTMESEAQIVAGTGSQTGTSNRWGDYTSMAIDASDDCTFWYTNQYYMTTASFDWSTRLASFKFSGCGSSSGTRPGAPTSLSANAVNTYQISLSWQEAASQNQTGFNIYRCTGATCTNFAKIASVGNVLTYGDGSISSPLSESTTYSYEVTAFNGAGESGPSNINAAPTPSEPAPTNLTSSAALRGHGKNQKDSVTLTWINHSTDADGNHVERCTGSSCSNFSETAITGASATTYTDTSVATKTTYSYRVRAHSPGGYSVYSNITTVATP